VGKLTEDLKLKLKASGRWPEFTAYREELKAQGMSGKAAQFEAVSHFFDNPPDIIGQSGTNYKDPKRDPEDFPVTDLQVDAKKALKDAEDLKEDFSVDVEPSVKGGPVARLPALRTDFDQFIFEDKVASEVEIVRWVARNMSIGDPDPYSCPDATAWSLLSHCRSSMLAASEFWKQTYTKLLPSKTQMEAMKKETETDGSKATEVIDELIDISKKAVEECGAG